MRRADVVLVHIPFVGGTGGKMRPALILQNDALNAILRETIIAEITSNLRNTFQPHQVLIDLSSPGGAATGLLMDSAIRCERLHTIPQADVRSVIGHLSPAIMQRVEAALKSSIGM